MIPLWLALGALPALASPVTYTIGFTGTGTLPDFASFTFDSANDTFSNFVVDWEGYVFDLTAAANNETFKSALVDPCYSSAVDGPGQLYLMLTSCSSDADPTYNTGAPQWIGGLHTDPPPNNIVTFDFNNQPSGLFPAPKMLVALATDLYTTGTGNIAYGSYSSSLAPEPGSIALMALGLAALGSLAARRSGRKA